MYSNICSVIISFIKIFDERNESAMETTINVPVQMISVCSTVGDLTPMRFRYEDEDHSIQTITIESVLGRKEVTFNGIREIQYTCKASILGISRVFILKYSISNTKWKLFQVLS